MARSPSSSKHDWRRSAKPDVSAGRRLARRILVTACLLVLTGTLVWLLWPNPRPGTNFVVLPVTEYRLRIQPAPAFPANVTRLEEAARAGKFSLLDGFPQLEGALSKQTGRSILVLCITAHGVSQGGKAYLLADDFDVAEPDSGRLELGRLFEQLRKCPARMKLLILEAGHTVTDPRLGMLVNEFPRLLESELAAMDAPNLWVLLASQSLETSHVSYSLGQSVFSHFVVEGFSGAADPERNNPDLDLRVLSTFVRDGVTQWVKRHSQGSQTQTPLLLHAGEGRVNDPPEGLFLLHVPKPDKPKPDESESDADEETAPAEDQEPVEEPITQTNPNTNPKRKRGTELAASEAIDESSPSPTDREETPPAKEKPAPKSSADLPDLPDTPDTPGEPPAEAPVIAAAPEDPSLDTPHDRPIDLPDDADPLAAVRRLLDAAWHWRDELQSRRADGWSPVDYAPHLWHEYQELILVHERRWRYQMPLTDGQLITLQRLAGGRLPTSGSGEGTVLDRLAGARLDFLQGQTHAGFDRWSGQLPGVERAVQLRNDLMFEVPYYLRWHARSAGVSPDDRALFRTIRRLIDQLGRLDGLLESMQPQEETPQTSPPNPRAKLAQLASLTETLQALRDDLTDRELNAQAQNLLEDAAEGMAFTKMECLLWTPLLEADLRLALLDTLEKMPNPSEDTIEIAPYTVGDDEWYDKRRSDWAALANQAELEVAAIQKLADPDFRTTWEPADLSDGGSREAERELWTAYRGLGLELAEFHGGLPRQINRALRSDDPQAARSAARNLPLVDPREVHSRIDALAGRLATRSVAWPAMIGIRPTIEGPESVALEPGEWSEFSLRIRTTGRRVATLSMLPDFDRAQLTVQSHDGRTTYLPKSPLEVNLGPDGEKTLRLRVRPADGVEKFTPLSIGITAEDNKTSHRISFLIPPPDRVDLVVQRIFDAGGRLLPCPAGDVGVIRCPVFPNRPGEYRLGLKNLSGKTRTVSVRFWSVPQRNPQRTATRSGPLNDIGRPLPGFSPLADPVEIELPADDRLVPLAFPVAADAEKEKKETDGPNPDTEAEKPAAPDAESAPRGTPVTHGIVCQIADTQGGDPWIQWIDFDWVTPFEFIQPSVSYSLSQRRVSIELRLRDDLSVTPHMLSETPISVIWENAGELPENTSPNFKDSIGGARDVAHLSAENIDPDVTRQIQIRLAVDGYPRALTFDRFDCDSDHRRIDVDDNLTAIEITQPQPAEAYRLTDEGLEPAMSVKFKVDAPYDALGRADDFVAVGIDKNGNLQFDQHEDDLLRFHTDRQREAVLQELTPEGTLKLFTRVDDFTVELSPAGPANKEVLVLAQLFIAGRKSAQHEVPVVLDRGRPEISLEPLPNLIPPGSRLTVAAKVTDVSGVELVEFGFDVNRSEDLEDDEKPVPVFAAGADGIWKAALDTKGLRPGATYSLIVRATDRVGSTAKLRTLLTVGTVPEEVMPEKPKTVTVLGRAYLGSPARTAGWSRLDIAGVPGTLRIDKSSGDFTFSDVPSGNYTLVAEGTSGNRTKKGSATVTVTGDERTARVDIPMD